MPELRQYRPEQDERGEKNLRLHRNSVLEPGKNPGDERESYASVRACMDKRYCNTRVEGYLFSGIVFIMGKCYSRFIKCDEISMGRSGGKRWQRKSYVSGRRSSTASPGERKKSPTRKMYTGRKISV